jgi:D-serine deaminase-like pyridoxal phosphate-dependent protein
MAAVKYPNLEEILIANGVAVDEAKKRIAELSARFPDGVIPAGVINQWIDEFFNADRIRIALTEVAVAWSKVAKTGKGPVAPIAGVELS